MANKSQNKSTEQQPNRHIKRPFFAYLYVYCVVRDLTEQEALEEIAQYSGASLAVLQAAIHDQEQFNSLPTSIAIKVSRIFNLTLQGVELTNTQGQNVVPMSFEISDFQINLNKQKWFKQSLKDDKRFGIKPSVANE